MYHEAKKIDPISWVPADFLGREALLEGKAVSEDKKAFIAGNDWRLEVDSKAGWPVDLEGKKVEGVGTIRKTEMSKTYKLEKGETRLVKLEDQLGRHVTLRGTAWSMNGFWWFSYRGTQMYALGMEDLSGWKVEFHGQPILISGILEKAMLPDIDQISLKTYRDGKSYFVIRKPSWKKIDALLIPEMDKED